MTTEEITKIVTTCYAKKYRVKLADGKSMIVRLWRHSDGKPCIISKGKRNYGHYLNSWGSSETEDWVSLTEVNSNVDYVKRITKRAKDAKKMLEESGLWPDIKKEIEDFLALPEDKVKEFVEAARENFYENVYKHLYEKDNKFPWLHSYQVFESFLRNTCWKAPNFGKWRDYDKNALSSAIAEKRDYSLRWTDGYDNSVEISFKYPELPRGWYSEEYRGCGNGHYYLLFDAKHAIFYEDD